MRSLSWKLGRVAGIDVFVHPTFLLILLFPQVREGGWLVLATVLALFGCVLLHELGHALMARRFGIETQDITLYPIGGVARLLRIPRSPGAELAIALAGPAVNFAIVAGLLGLDFLGLVGPWSDAAGVLIGMNLMLGLFNLIPAFPMDGGRVLRALLSPGLGRLRATQVAAGLGRGLAILFGLFGLSQGVWNWVFLSAFIYVVAGMELAGVAAEENRDRYEGDGGDWKTPPGYRWVQQGHGAWQLAPIVINARDGNRPRWN
jgi:Zn-dependent protease